MSIEIKTLTYKDIQSWNPCYNISIYLPVDFSGTIFDILAVSACPLYERVWVIARHDLMPEDLACKIRCYMRDKRYDANVDDIINMINTYQPPA